MLQKSETILECDQIFKKVCRSMCVYNIEKCISGQRILSLAKGRHGA